MSSFACRPWLSLVSPLLSPLLSIGLGLAAGCGEIGPAGAGLAAEQVEAHLAGGSLYPLASASAYPAVGSAPEASSGRGPLTGSAAVPEALRFALVVGDRVLLDSRADDAWGSGPPTQEDHPPPAGTLMGRAVDPARLPAGLRGIAGQRVSIFGETGVLCEATVQEPRLYGVFFGAPGRDEDAADRDDQDEQDSGAWGSADPRAGASGTVPAQKGRQAGASQPDGPVPRWLLPSRFSDAPRQITATAGALWRMAGGGQYLMAELRYDTPGCTAPASAAPGPASAVPASDSAAPAVASGRADLDELAAPVALRWARAAGLPAPALAVPQSADPALISLALAAQRDLPTYREIQGEYDGWFAEASAWAAEERKSTGGGDRADDAEPGARVPLNRVTRADSWQSASAPPEVRLLRLSAAGEATTLLLVRNAGTDGTPMCGLNDRFATDWWTLWEVGGAPGDPRLVLRAQGRDMPPIAGAVDDGGAVRLLYRGEHSPGALLPDGESPYEDAVEFTGSDYDFVCPC